MEFLNEQVQFDKIPDAWKVTWQPAEKDYLKVLRLKWMIFSTILLLVCIASVVFIAELQKLLLLFVLGASWLFIVLFYYFIQEKSFRYLAYAVREQDILYRRGWIIQQVIACPYNRIQHCSADAGPLDRKYNLSSLTLFTAGTSGADLKIAGLKATDALNLREFIMGKIKTDEQAGN